MIKHIKRAIKRKIDFKREIKIYNSKCSDIDFLIDKENINPQLKDKYESAGTVDGHYFFQDIYFARKVLNSEKEVHYDIGSRIDGFISHLLSSEKIKKLIMLDIRPFPYEVDGLGFIQTDATELNNIPDNSIDSISSLHAIEHFGLGRYGDDIDPDAWKKALKSIQNKMAVGGYFYFSVPISTKNTVCFNAHRMFSPLTIVNELDKLELISFAYIHNYKIYEVDINNFDKDINNISKYDCGLFVFKKNVQSKQK